MTWINGTFIIAKLIIMKSESRYQLISRLSINKIFSFKILVLMVMAFCSALNAAEPIRLELRRSKNSYLTIEKVNSWKR